MRACTVVAHSMELDELLFSSFFMDHGNNNEAKSLSSNTVKTIDADSSDTNSQIISEWVWNLGDTHKLVVSCKKHDGTVINRFVDLKSQA